MPIIDTLEKDIFHEGGLARDWPAEDVQAGAPLHVAYFDCLTCLYIRAEGDIRGHSDHPSQQHALCDKLYNSNNISPIFNMSIGLFPKDTRP
jgi:hypothetical protein